ncbi:hypothetical protein V6N11_062017 [Hibiscus sabdariffa]|uniref:CCHC-type domain-containing protein n=1 Tax=Hibiscus sabdariffa TaxID=183260 RepID=A0ABR2PRW8_9ROSI
MSEKSGEFKTPSARSGGLTYGRPPDLIHVSAALTTDLDKEIPPVQNINAGPFLERPCSPLESDIQRQCKKSRSDGVQGLSTDSDSMEVEENGQTLNGSTGGDDGSALLSKVGSPVSYADIVGGSARGFEKDKDGFEELPCDLNNVEVLDEDCVVDKSGLHHICYNCGVYGHLKESCMGNDGRNGGSKEDPIVPERERATNEESTKERDLFGPWMMVDSRRNRTPTRRISTAKLAGPRGTESVNCFAMLEDKQTTALEEHDLALGEDTNVEQVEQVPRLGNLRPAASVKVSAAAARKGVMYRGSTSNGNAKGNSRGAETAVVLPMVEGQQVSVVERSVLGGNSEHAAVSLIEEGHGNVKSKGVVHGKLHGVRRGVRDGVQQADDDPGGTARAVVNQDGDLEPAGKTVATHGIRATIPAESLALAEDGSMNDL